MLKLATSAGAHSGAGAGTVSIVVPIYNEQDNVALLIEEVERALVDFTAPWELILVDDGSSDETVPRLQRLAESRPFVRLVLLRRNFGQTAAMHAGIQHAAGDIIVTIDGDLQNDPADIPRLVAKIEEGYDLVHGWRKHRQDRFLNRKLPSKIANWLISRVTGFPIHDLGCTLKALRRDLAQQLELYGEMHRFIPILAHQIGARSCELVTNHRARKFGTTKYGIGRTTRVVLDLMTVRFLQKYFDSPMKFFGKLGMLVGGLAFLAALGVVGMKLFAGTDMTGNPLLLLSILATILSAQFFSMGLLGEVNARIYFANGRRQNYQVRDLVNFEQRDFTHPVRKQAG
jgi:glycosyltransferase involved in cell wall biosynthesis